MYLSPPAAENPGNGPPSLPQFLVPYRWTSVPLTKIGQVNFRASGICIYDIPELIPNNAKEVLVYVYAQVGHSRPTSTTHIKVYTEDRGNEYAKYIGFRTFRQDARNTNSDNLWFPMPANRKVNLEILDTYEGHTFVFVYVIGYR